MGDLNSEADKIKDYSSFCPKKYFQEYYSKLGRENKFLLEFFHKAYQNTASDSRVLEFGGGPTIYQTISAAKNVKEIIFADYLQANRDEVKSWLKKEPQALNWSSYFDYVNSLNGQENTLNNRLCLKDQVSEKITEIIECDAYMPDIIGKRSDNKFDIVSSNFCLECIDGRENMFVEFIEKISGLVENKGKLILTMLKNAHSYQIDDSVFPAFPISEEYINKLLKRLGYTEIEIKFSAAEHNQGYEGIIALQARKPSI